MSQFDDDFDDQDGDEEDGCCHHGVPFDEECEECEEEDEDDDEISVDKGTRGSA